jgi:hypothetical protein
MVELPKFTIVMQCHDNKTRFWWLYFGCFYFKKIGFARILPSSLVSLVLYQGPYIEPFCLPALNRLQVLVLLSSGHSVALHFTCIMSQFH